MASNSETGHAINVTNFKTLISEVEKLGGRYLPSDPSLEVVELKKDVEPGNNSVKAVAAPKEVHDTTADLQREANQNLEVVLKNGVSNLLTTKGVTKEQITRYKTVVNLVTGANVTAKINKKKAAKGKASTTTDQEPTNPEITEAQHSVSQQSYAKRIANSYDAVSILESIANYKPKDATATTTFIRGEIDKAAFLNDKEEKDYKPYSAALKTRDIALYKDETGIVSKAKTIKAYIRTNSNFTSVEKKAFAQIKFTKPAKKYLHF